MYPCPPLPQDSAPREAPRQPLRPTADSIVTDGGVAWDEDTALLLPTALPSAPRAGSATARVPAAGVLGMPASAAEGSAAAGATSAAAAEVDTAAAGTRAGVGVGVGVPAPAAGPGLPSSSSRSGSPLAESDAALLGLLSELPGCSPAFLLSTAAELLPLRGGSLPPGSPLRRTREVTALRFLLLYVRYAQPLPSLAACWSPLLTLLRAAHTPTAPLLLVLLCEWAARVDQLGDGSPLARPKERREATDACDMLVKLTTKAIGGSVSRGDAQGGANGSLPSLDAHSPDWDGDEQGVVALLALERCMMSLLSRLHARHSPKRQAQFISLIGGLMPAILSPLDAIASGSGSTAAAAAGSSGNERLKRSDRLARASLRVLLQVTTLPSATRIWRMAVGRLFGLPNFFFGLTRRTLPLWSRVVNAWLGLETPKAAVAILLAGKMGRTVGWFAGKAAEAEAHADLLRRLSFTLWVGERNQYVGALQGMLIDRVVAGYKYGLGSERADAVRWIVQVQALFCTRVLAVRVAAEHLTALWPIAMAELQRVLLAPSSARPALLLAACQLVDTLLAVLPDDFSAFGWMFVPAAAPEQPQSLFSSAADDRALSTLDDGALPTQPPHLQLSEPSTLADQGPLPAYAPNGAGADERAASTCNSWEDELADDSFRDSFRDVGADGAAPPLRATSFASAGAPEFAALLAPLARLGNVAAANVPGAPAMQTGLLKPSADGRRRPLLGVQRLTHASELAPFASQLHRHLAASAVLPRSAEVDLPMLELLLGCEFLSEREANAALAPHLQTAAEARTEAGARTGAPGRPAFATSLLSGLATAEEQLEPGGPHTPPAGGASTLSERLSAAQRCTPHETL